MREKTVSIILLGMLLLFACLLPAYPTGGNNEQNVNKAEFLVKAFKNTSSSSGDGTVPHQDVPPSFKVVDSLSLRLGKESGLATEMNAVSPSSMNAFMDEFFNTGIHVAMITVSGVTGYGDKSSESAVIPAIPGFPETDTTSDKVMYAPHTTSLTITAAPVSLSVDGVPGGSASAFTRVDKGTVGPSSSYPVEIFIRTSKVTAREGKNRPVSKLPEESEPAGHGGGGDMDEWFGRTKRSVRNDQSPGVNYKEYTLTSKYADSVPGKLSSASLTMVFSNNTHRQEYDGSRYAWGHVGPGEGKDERNVQWTAENQIWIRGDRAAFDAVKPGLYRLILEITITAD